MTDGNGTVGQNDQNGGTTRVVTRQVFFQPQPYPYYPYSYPPTFAPSAAMQFTFEVMAEQPVSTDTRVLNSWAEALAHAQALYTQTPRASRVIVTDQSGARRIYPGAAPQPYFPQQPFATPYPYFSLFPTSITRTRIRTLAGGTLGQRPVEVFDYTGPGGLQVNGVQRLTREARDYAVGVLATLYSSLELNPPVPAIEQSGVFSGLTFYTADAYAARFPDFNLPQPGLQGAAPGSLFVINVDDLVRFGQALASPTTAPPQDTIRVVVAPDAQQAATIATTGSDWAFLETTPIATPAPAPEKKGVSPAAIAAGIAAAAVAAILIFA
jgi:hypothetical protein